ncbi:MULTISPECIES: beta-ketoacyl-[acyl-carrier-protein] synthase family protein [Acinetobacter]|uniref:beta-ketoacyl-[acyl-carrier-protein] synthase family protein n=1 Tax=Acinetobacter TaxID=469 RepID=UPI0015D200D8|nr:MULTISPECIES: beta-ketoacyl-[acyl-carrier-protein] synthase family protein [Acinetobacter]MCO8060042.1 beta-ketoacyl-[acyl-carrier-protein] synthase family protein [Acinetobacter towneri]MCO8065692.1 beta-ketoacyl-[acyl-carrier-protein] synthase family protein [Acinetobacter towneri]
MTKKMQHSSAVGIQCSVALSALGQNVDNIRRTLTSEENSLSLRDDLIAGRKVWVGAYNHPLIQEVPEDLSGADSRNLRFALTALMRIEAEVHNYTAQFPKHRLAVIIGTSTSGVADNEPVLKACFQKKILQGVWHKKQEMGCLAKALQQYLGWSGPAYTISTACSSAAKAMAAGRRMLNANLVDAVLVGGVDTLCKLTLNGFDSLESLSTDICQPCGASRDGINIGEAAGLFLLSKESAPVCLLSTGESMDAWHISAPHPEGLGAIEAMRKALEGAGLHSSDIDYLNLHGTSTPQNDSMEIKAVQAVFADQQVALSSTKHKTGHCLGAAGAIEAFICQQVLLDQAWLPLHHSGELDFELITKNYVRNSHLEAPIRYVMSNSFAFGGSNISLIMGTVSP